VSQPPYQLRPNKAVDRLMFMDVIRRLERFQRLDEYNYYSLGGPFLEDFRVLYEVSPKIGMTSIDTNADVIKRQKSNLPCRHLKLKRGDLKTFITRYDAKDRKSIFWLDYTRLVYSEIDDFRALLSKVAANSVVKITLQAKSALYFDAAKREAFKEEFALLLPDPGADPPASKEDFARLVQQMVRIASQRAFPSPNPMVYQPLCSFNYSDGTPMLTVTGIVCLKEERDSVRRAFGDWQFASLHWAAPKRIAVPQLTTKERLRLQDCLPTDRDAGRTLRRSLGYLIDEDRTESNEMMKQYARFHRYSPHYLRGIP
jgi:hypothetical protein